MPVRQRNRRSECHLDRNFFAGHRAFAMGRLVGSGMDAVYDGVRDREAGIHKRSAEAQAAIELEMEIGEEESHEAYSIDLLRRDETWIIDTKRKELPQQEAREGVALSGRPSDASMAAACPAGSRVPAHLPGAPIFVERARI